MPPKKLPTNKKEADPVVQAEPDKNASKFNKTVHKPKPGRTLVVKLISGSGDLEQKKFSGLVSNTPTKNGSSCFLTFDSIKNAENAYKEINGEPSKYEAKYSYYRVFVKFSNLTNDHDYLTVKKDLTKLVETTTKASVLYCRLYNKDNNYLGCGDFIIDTFEGMNELLNNLPKGSTETDTNPKQFDTVDQKLSYTFYRYNNKKEKLGKQNEPEITDV